MANSNQSGDDLAGLLAHSAVERVAARPVISDATLRGIPVVPYESDELTRRFMQALDDTALQGIGSGRSGSSASG